MKIIVISPAEWISNEAEAVIELFQHGLQKYHLRKPMAKQAMLIGFLEKIPPEYMKKISIHASYKLAAEMELGGIHITESGRRIMPPVEKGILDEWKTRFNLNISTSIHHPADLSEVSEFDYAFCSPVFDSISKENYSANPIWQKPMKKQKCSLIALGGVHQENISLVSTWGYDGAALLGAIWQNSEMALSAFKKLQDLVDKNPEANPPDMSNESISINLIPYAFKIILYLPIDA